MLPSVIYYFAVAEVYLLLIFDYQVRRSKSLKTLYPLITIPYAFTTFYTGTLCPEQSRAELTDFATFASSLFAFIE